MNNVFEKQAELGRTMFEINSHVMQEMAKQGQENMQKYFDMNNEFGQRLPEVRDITTFVELQREYGEAFWAGVRTASEGQAELLKNAAEQSGDALRKAFATES